MKKLATRTFKNHRYEAGGRVWIVPAVRLALLPDGQHGISLAEISRIQRGIVHALCMGDGDLTPDEFEFLCDATDTTQSEAARAVGLSRSAVSKWRARGSGPVGPVGSALKRFFWVRHFADRIARFKAPVRELATDAALLRYVRDHTREVDLDAPTVRAA